MIDGARTDFPPVGHSFALLLAAGMTDISCHELSLLFLEMWTCRVAVENPNDIPTTQIASNDSACNVVVDRLNEHNAQ